MLLKSRWREELPDSSLSGEGESGSSVEGGCIPRAAVETPRYSPCPGPLPMLEYFPDARCSISGDAVVAVYGVPRSALLFMESIGLQLIGRE